MVFKNIHPTAAYFGTTLSYGFVRKAIEMKNATMEYRDYEKRENKRVPMLMCDKITTTLASMVMSITLWPMYLYNDLRKLELACRKVDLKPEWYGITEKKSANDYWFT